MHESRSSSSGAPTSRANAGAIETARRAIAATGCADACPGDARGSGAPPLGGARRHHVRRSHSPSASSRPSARTPAAAGVVAMLQARRRAPALARRLLLLDARTRHATVGQFGGTAARRALSDTPKGARPQQLRPGTVAGCARSRCRAHVRRGGCTCERCARWIWPAARRGGCFCAAVLRQQGAVRHPSLFGGAASCAQEAEAAAATTAAVPGRSRGACFATCAAPAARTSARERLRQLTRRAARGRAPAPARAARLCPWCGPTRAHASVLPAGARRARTPKARDDS